MLCCAVQEAMWKIGEMIGDREGRMDVCAAVAGIFSGVNVPAMDKPKELFQKVRFGGLLSNVAWRAQDGTSFRVRIALARTTGDGRERWGRPVHCASRGAADDPLRERREHHPRREHLWEHRNGGT